MLDCLEHPTIIEFKKKEESQKGSLLPVKMDINELKKICIQAGVDDVGFVEIERKELTDQKDEILELFPHTKTVVSFVCRLNRDNIRVPARSIASKEYHTVAEHADIVAHNIVMLLEREGIRAVNPAVGFPMEMCKWPGKTWVVSHKPIAVAAGLGKTGVHRSVIHPKFGSFIMLGTILIDKELTSYSKPLEFNPCLECKLCVSVCPTGAISSDGYFNFANCLTHTYRELLGGFSDWVENIADSKTRLDYRGKVTDAETVSMWQNLTFGSTYKSVYCIAACPAGEDVVGAFINDRKGFVKDIVRPLQDKKEDIYAVPGSDVEDYVTKHFPRKQVKHIGNGLRARTIKQFLDALPLIFQRNKSTGIDAVFHFTFTGNEESNATVIIKNKTVEVKDFHFGKCDVHVIADSTAWLQFLAKERNIVWAIIRRKIRVKGAMRLLLAFGKCFP